LLGKFRFAVEASHEVYCLADGHGDAEIQRDSAVLTDPAGYLFEAIGDIRLSALVEFHVSVDREAVSAFHADSSPFAVRLHEAAVDSESIPFANGAVDRRESLFNFFRGEGRHSRSSFRHARISEYNERVQQTATVPSISRDVFGSLLGTTDTEIAVHVISEALILGNIDEARNPMPGIAGLLLVAEEFRVEPPAWLDYEYIPFKEFSVVDPVLLDRAVAWLETRPPRTRTLVCCRAGMGRSASVVIAYLCCYEGLPYEEAVILVKARRPGAMPLPQLKETIERVMTLRAARASRKSGPASGPRVL